MPSPATSSRAGRPATATSTASPTSPRCAGPTWLPKTALVLCDLFDRPREAGRGLAAPHAAAPARSGRREAGFTVMGGTEIELYVFNDSFADGAGEELPRPAADGGLQRGLPHPPGHQGGGAHRRHPPRTWTAAASRSRSARARPGSGQQEINLRYSEALDAGRPQRPLQARGQGDRLGAGQGGHLHGEVGREAHRVERATSTSACGTRTASGNAFPGDRPIGPVEASDTFRWFLGGWIAARARALRLLRALRRLLQALPVALLGADRASPGATTTAPPASASSATARRCASSAASRAPTPIPTSPTPPPSPPASTASRNQIEPPRDLPGRRLRRAAICRASPAPCARRSASSSRATLRARGLRRGRGRALPPLLPHRAAQVRRGGDLTGSGRGISNGHEDG